jgi:hypothetical protein
MSLMPVALNPEDDDCLTVPFLGRDPRGGDRPLSAKGKLAAGREEEDAQEVRGTVVLSCGYWGNASV